MNFAPLGLSAEQWQQISALAAQLPMGNRSRDWLKTLSSTHRESASAAPNVCSPTETPTRGFSSAANSTVAHPQPRATAVRMHRYPAILALESQVDGPVADL